MTYAVDSREDVLSAADICLEHGVQIETGPHKHVGRTIVWTEAERRKGQGWGLQTLASFHSHGTPSTTRATDGEENDA